MKKYIQYPPSSPSQYVKPVSEVGGRSRATAGPNTAPNNDCNEMVLDLSGKPGNSSVAMVAGQKWTNEQEAALDLTSYGKQTAASGQAEALDLSKPSTPKPHHAHSQSLSSPDLIYQSQQPLQAPAALSQSQSRSLASQYSLLQAALNSGQSMAAFQTVQSAPLESRAQIFGRGATSLIDGGSRSIRPFSSGTSHRNSTVAVVQGVHKPVAITTPQPHNSSVNTTTHSTSQSSVTATISNQSAANSSQSCSISQSGYSAVFQTPPSIPTGLGRGSGTVNQVTGSFLPGFSKGVDGLIERYIIQTPDGTSHIVGGKDYAHIEPANAYPCSQCPKAFKTKAALKLHTTVHKTAAERQYECETCQRRFLHRHHLVVHQRKHSGEKPFKCNACSKTFMAIFLLHKHLRKHARETGLSSLISTEQLQKLHLKKVTSDGMEGVIGGTANPVVVDTDPVIVSDDEETPTKVTVEIGVAEKGINEGQAVVACPDKNVLSEATGATEVKEALSKEMVIDLVSDDLQSCSSALDLVNKAAIKELNESPSGKSEKCTGIINKMISNEAKESSKTESTRIECDKVTAVNDNEPLVEHENPFPTYTTDDEVELDFETGELKILNKIPDITNEKNLKIEMDEKSIKTAESTSEINEYGEDDIPKLEPQIEIKDTQIGGPVGSKCTESVFRDKTEFHVVDDDSADFKKSGSDTETLSAESDVPSMDESEETAVSAEQKVADDSLEIPKLELACVLSNDKLSTSENAANIVDHPAADVETEMNKQVVSSKKKSKRAKCELCSKTFYSNHHLLLHMSVHKKNPMLQSLKKAKANQMKALGFPGKGSVNCSICKKVFKFQKSLNCHMRVHSEKLAQNRRLSKEFRDFVSNETVLSTPITRSKGMDVPSVSSVQSQLKNSHDGVKSLDKNLDECSTGTAGVEIESQGSLSSSQVKNIAKVSDNQDDFPIQFIIGKDKVKRFVCYACDNTYTTKQKLKMHALIHKDNCFLCEICGKSFFRQMTLDKHIATHLLPRPHVCIICKKSFIHRSSLMRHKVIHERPSVPSLKQQVADVKFEMKMLDTYTLLKQERIQKLQMQHPIHALKVDAASTDRKEDVLDLSSTDRKEDVLDLSMRGKVDTEQSHPPVLSLEIPPKVSAASMNLSPPLITREICSNKQNTTFDPLLRIKEEPMSTNGEEQMSTTQQQPVEPSKISVKIGDKSRKRVVCDVYGPKPPSFHTFLKKSRKTRVYQTSCRVCKESFPNIVALKEHMSVHNVVETHLYECHICHHRFTQSCSLLRHLKTSCQEKQMKCDPCGKTFQRKNSFEHHMRTHQGGPPNLDGSFYDNRKDEVQIKEEIVDRESDIENNNIKIVDVKPELSQLEESFGIQPQNLRIHIKDENDSDSDARTYLYSEGEVHNAMSDLSDADCSPPRTPATDVSLPNTLQVSPNIMTLNLLSAVCSDIRNAEREEEMRCQELEERQKELETIEILANLKRTRLQNTPPVPDTPNSVEQPVAPLHLARQHAQKIDLSRKKGSLKSDIGGSKGSKSSSNVTKGNRPLRPFSVNSESNDCQIIDSPEPTVCRPDTGLPNVIPPMDQKSGKGSTTLPQIPTVVLELAAEAERLRRERISHMMRNKILNLQQGKDDLPTVEINTQNLLQELSHVNIPHNTVIQNRLSLLMKAQIPPSAAATTASSTVTSLSSTSIAPFSSTVKSTVAPISKSAHYSSLPSSSLQSSSTSSLSMAAAVSSHSVSMATRISPSKPFTASSASTAMMPVIDNLENSPQDLSMKQPVKKVVPSASVSPIPSTSKATVAAPPPLVPVFHCELCGMLMYRKRDLHAHMREHGVSPKSSPSNTPQMSPEHPGGHSNTEQPSASWQEDIGINADKPKTSDSSNIHGDTHVRDSGTPQTVKKLAPPTTLDLPLGITAGFSPSKALALAQLSCDSPDLSSPMTSSDLSDTLQSPLTPSSSSAVSVADLAGIPGTNLDELRKELRNKIYARRRSQGLEELTVEFKSPEPTEMTEDEKKKLNYRRECNRQAAQRSRMRKKDLVDSLLEELHCEEVVNSDLRRKMESLVVEKHSLLKALDSHTCVKTELPSKSDSDTPS